MSGEAPGKLAEKRSSRMIRLVTTTRGQLLALAALVGGATVLLVAMERFWTQAEGLLPERVELVDYNADCYNANHGCVLDLWVSHQSTEKDLVLSTMEFELVDKEEVHVSGKPLSPKVYDCNLSSLQTIGDTYTCSVSHLVPRQEAGKPDHVRLRLAFSRPDDTTFYRMVAAAQLRTNLGRVRLGQIALHFPWNMRVSPQDPATR